jgi:TonB family protein
MKRKMSLLITLMVMLPAGGLFAANEDAEAIADLKMHALSAKETDQVMPEFPGGKKALNAFLSKNVKYPRKALQNEIQGKVYVRFLVKQDGTVDSAQVVEGLCPECDAEALRLISILPKWSPARVNGRIVPMTILLPVRFTLVM